MKVPCRTKFASSPQVDYRGVPWSMELLSGCSLPRKFRLANFRPAWDESIRWAKQSAFGKLLAEGGLTSPWIELISLSQHAAPAAGAGVAWQEYIIVVG